MCSNRLLRERLPYHLKGSWLNGLNSLLVQFHSVELGQGSRVAHLPVHQPQNKSKSWIRPGRAATSLPQKKSAPPSNLSVTFLLLLSSPSRPTSFPFHGATSARGWWWGGGVSGMLHTKAKGVQVKQLYRYLFISHHLWLKRCLWSFSSSWLFSFTSGEA